MIFLKKDLLILCIFLCMISCSKVLKSNTDTSKTEIVTNYEYKIDSIFKNSNQDRKFNGVILIADSTKIKYCKSFGYADFEKKTPIKNTDKFLILSISKQITAVLLLRLVESGKVVLDKPIDSYLTELNPKWSSEITVKNLLNHTSGIEELTTSLLFKPNSGYKYSNANYVLLGKIIEKVSGRTYKDLFKELMKECKMNHTIFPDKDFNDFVHGYNYVNGIQSKTDKITFDASEVPAGGVISTVQDLLLWNNKLYEGSLVSKKSFQEMITPYSETKHSVFGDTKMYYGFALYVNDKNKEVGHTGYSDSKGFTVLNLYYLNSKKSLITIENQTYEIEKTPFLYEKMIRDMVFAIKNN
jgi:D-alanyl-D-alanine carboxypeptidase